MSGITHGGQLYQAIARFGGAPTDWIDLSTTIAPWPYPLPPPPRPVWQRLPEPDDGLAAAIRHYYGAEGLPIPGTQAALQWLPVLFPTVQRVVVPTPSYGEYRQVWRAAGRTVVEVPLVEAAIEAAIATADALMIGQPNNPTGHTWPDATIARWHARLAARGGLLVIDAAFADAAQVAAGTPSPLAAWARAQRGVLVLRSLGKFFGLAGVRLGVLFTEPAVTARFAEALGPWAVSHPARWAAQQALTDRAWQRRQVARLCLCWRRLNHLLVATGWLATPLPADAPAAETPPWGLTPYAITLPTSDPLAAATALAQNRVLVRPFPEAGAVRLGIPPPPRLSSLAKRLRAARPSTPLP